MGCTTTTNAHTVEVFPQRPGKRSGWPDYDIQ